MAKTPDIDDVERRVDEYLQQRREAVRALSKTHAALQHTKDDAESERQALEERLAVALKDAQTSDAQAWNSALSAGWTEEELRRLGFVEPAVKTRSKRRRAAPAEQVPATRLTGAATEDRPAGAVQHSSVLSLAPDDSAVERSASTGLLQQP